MANPNIDDKFKAFFEERTLSPKENAWDRLETLMPANEQVIKRNRKPIYWLAAAATFIGFVLVLVMWDQNIESPEATIAISNKQNSNGLDFSAVNTEDSIFVNEIKQTENKVKAKFNIRGFDPLHALGYAASAALTGTFWAALLLAGTRQRGRLRAFFLLGFLLLYPLQLGVQSAFFRMYNVYCNYDALLEYRTVPSTWTCALPWDARTQLAPYLAASVVLALALLYAARTFARPRRLVRRNAGAVAFLLGSFMFAGPVSYRTWQSSSPDQIYFNAVGVAVREQFPPSRRLNVTRTQRRASPSLPALAPAGDELYRQLSELPFPPALAPRMQFEGFEIVRPLKQSSRSHIFLAVDKATGDRVVIKTPSVDQREDPAYLERFLMEEWIARRINIPMF